MPTSKTWLNIWIVEMPDGDVFLMKRRSLPLAIAQQATWVYSITDQRVHKERAPGVLPALGGRYEPARVIPGFHELCERARWMDDKEMAERFTFPKQKEGHGWDFQ